MVRVSDYRRGTNAFGVYESDCVKSGDLKV
jgi:hypothetical protein